jgi:hypothetical protein
MSLQTRARKNGDVVGLAATLATPPPLQTGFAPTIEQPSKTATAPRETHLAKEPPRSPRQDAIDQTYHFYPTRRESRLVCDVVHEVDHEAGYDHH